MLIVLISFILGELLLILLVIWTYTQLRRAGIFPRDRFIRLLIGLTLFIIPIALAMATLPGIISRMRLETSFRPPPENTPTPQDVLPVTGGSPEGEGTPLAVQLTPQARPSPTIPEDLPLIRLESATKSPTGALAKATPAAPPTFTPSLAETTASTPPPSALPPSPTSTLPAGPLGKIVYVCQLFVDTKRDQICLIQADGSGFRRLTTNDNTDYNFPSLAPDGESIIYASNETGLFEIYEMQLDGEIRQLTDGAGESYGPEISPDGSQVVFIRKVEGHNTLWVMNRDGSEARLIFGPPLGDGWDPTWSPDGSKVLFASNMTGAIQLITANADGSSVTPITDMQALSGRSDWSPSGSAIATYAGNSWEHEIFLMNSDGSDSRAITEGGNNLSPSFSPDGEWITFTSYRDLYRNENGCEIYIMRKDGSQITRLTTNEYCDWQPRWGP